MATNSNGLEALEPYSSTNRLDVNPVFICDFAREQEVAFSRD